MPVIVVGADTRIGMEVIHGLLEPGREVRAFVSDPEVASGLRAAGVKVALGDVSDDSHIQGAATNCFSAVLVTEAARDDRERSFAATPNEVLAGWAKAVSASRVKRAIWIGDEVPDVATPERAIVSPSMGDLVERVVSLDNAAKI
ncbi:MAG: NAD(P)H-binding protein [Acidimicrobiia bacterium]